MRKNRKLNLDGNTSRGRRPIRLTLAFTAIICASIWGSNASAEGPAVRRTTLLVSDAEASQAFYALIGFTEWLDWQGDQDPNDPTALPLTEKASESRIIIMAGEDSYNGMIGLLEFDGPPLASNRIAPEKLGVQDVILMIEANDVHAIHTHMSRAGYTVIRPPGPYESNGPAGRKQGYNMLVRDPDGYVVEVTDVRNDN